MKVYGPYRRKDGRRHVIIVDGHVRRTVSYPKYLLEQQLGRTLDPVLETVDHINGDFNDNSSANVRIVPLRQHAAEDATRAVYITVHCAWCGGEFQRHPRTTRNSNAKHAAGPFCSRPCNGAYGASIRAGRTRKPVQAPHASAYYKSKIKPE